MPKGTCLASSKLLARTYPELGYQEGILVMSFGGQLRTSVCHAGARLRYAPGDR
jgi:hypothetical protein